MTPVPSQVTRAIMLLDSLYLGITIVVTIGYQLFFFIIAYIFKFDKVTDLAGGTNFIVLAGLTFGSTQTDSTRNLLATILLIIWGARLSGFLFFRILKTGKDDRFDERREKFIPFLSFWILQAIWVWVVSLPVTILNSPRNLASSRQPAFGKGDVAATDILGVILWSFGFTLESVADAQRYHFRSKNPEKSRFLDSGVWAWSRHPNYFGEILVHFGIWFLAIGPAITESRAKAALYGSIVSPLFLAFLLLFISGIPLQEKSTAEKRWRYGDGWPEYQEYLRSTSILIPMPKTLWKSLPITVKRTIGMEFPMYLFDPEIAEGQRAAEEEQTLRNDQATEDYEGYPGQAILNDQRTFRDGEVTRNGEGTTQSGEEAPRARNVEGPRELE